jgi:methionine sulfoxide reductase heme-binding subunit
MNTTTESITRSSDRPLGTGRDLRRRLFFHHGPIALVSVAALVLMMHLPLFNVLQYLEGGMGHMGSTDHGSGHHMGAMGHAGHHAPTMGHGADHGGVSSEQIGHRLFMGQLTFASGYVALGLLALTLLIGPTNLLLGRRVPVSNYLTRDMGTWAAFFSALHTIVGLQVHGPPGATSLSERILSYFLGPDGRPLTNSFGLANWTGLAATVIVLGLLAISSDFALRKLKAGRWKWLQRLNYALFALVIAHAIFYGALLRRTSPFTALLVLSTVAVFGGQILGIWLWRRRSARKAAAAQ